MCLIRVQFWASVLVGFSIITPMKSARADTLDVAALRAAFQLSQTQECISASAPLSIVAVPASDLSQSLSRDQVTSIRSDFLAAFSAELPACARLTDAETAFGTVAFMTEVDSAGQLTKEQQDLIENKLQNAHSFLALKIDQSDERYRATVQLTSIRGGQTIIVTRYDLPEEHTSATCGGNAVSEKRGLSDLADELLRSVNPIRGLYVATGRYQDTDQAYGYGSYLTQQFLAALTQAQKQQLFRESFPIKLSEDPSGIGDNEYAVSLRYWVCDDNKSAKVVLSAVAPNGETVVFSRSLSLTLLPSGMTYQPSKTEDVDQFAVSDAQRPELRNSIDENLGLVTVSPAQVTTGDLLTVSAEPPDNCNPFFFDLAPGGRLTPLPLNIFDITEIRPGFVRYDNSEASKYGITIQAEDERGSHRLGFICQPDKMTNDDIRTVFRALRTRLAQTTAGVIEAEGTQTIYNTAQYDITD